MSTLRISNIEAKSVPASATVDEKVKITNSSGDPLVFIDGKTSGITTVGINTTDGNITFDANSNVVVTGIITATKFVGTIEPTNLTVGGDLTIPDKIIHTGDTNTAIRFPAADTITAETAGTEKVRITSAGKILIGSTSARVESNGFAAPLQVEGTGTATSSVIIARNSNNASSSNLIFQKSRGTSTGSNTVIQNNDAVGTIIFEGSDGTNTDSLASIIGACDGTPGTNDVPGRLVFSTTADGAASPTERLRITSTGAINLTSENTTGWQLDAGDNSASYTAIDNHFPTTNRTLYINNETTHRSVAFWNKNGSDGYGFGLDNSGNFKVVYGSSERLRIKSDGFVGINETNPSRHLHVNSGTSDIVAIFESSDTSAQIQIKDGTGTCTIECLNDFRFQNSTAEILRLKSDKDVQIMDGNLVVASGHGIDFSATGDAGGMTSELLDDYEEGSWTPALQFDVNGSGLSYGTRAGTYTKIGRKVTVIYYMVVSSGASSSDYFARLTLPFTGASVGHQDCRVRQWNNGYSDWFLSIGGGAPVFFHTNGAGSGANYARGDDVNGYALAGEYTYFI